MPNKKLRKAYIVKNKIKVKYNAFLRLRTASLTRVEGSLYETYTMFITRRNVLEGKVCSTRLENKIRENDLIPQGRRLFLKLSKYC